MLVLTTIIAQQGDFGELISLVGGSCQVLLAFSAPAAIALALSDDRGAVRNALNTLLLPAGVLVAAAGAAADLGVWS